MRRWRTRVGSVALLMAVACVTEVDDDRGAGWYPTSASASASVGSVGSTGQIEDTDTGGEDEGPTTGDSKEPGGTTMPTPSDPSDPASTTSPPGETSGPGQTAGDPVLDACLEVAANECETCGCTQCLDMLHACELDAGCVQIRECAQQSGCTDATSCYEACEDVINANGGVLGDPAALAAELAECMETSCPVCF